MRSGFLRYLTSDSQGPRARTAAVKVARIYYRDRWRVSPRRLGPHVDRIALDRPIFILGTQGSGGTLVGRCLRRDPAVATVSGGAEHWTGTDELGIVRSRMARLPHSLWGSSHRFDIPSDVVGTRHSSVFADDELLPLYRATGDDEEPEDAARFRRLLQEHLAVYRGSRFLDKTHSYTVKTPLLAQLLEGTEPRFVLVVRNPYGACPSAVERKPPSFRADVPDEQRLDLVAQHWANAHRIALEDAESAGGLAVVRFEDFLADPESVMRPLCAFVGLDYSPSMTPQPGQRMPWATLPTDRKWYPLYRDDRLERTTPAQAAIVEERCGPLATRFGYRPDGLDDRDEPVEIVTRGS
jgi:hypothetical protein